MRASLLPPVLASRGTTKRLFQVAALFPIAGSHAGRRLRRSSRVARGSGVYDEQIGAIAVADPCIGLLPKIRQGTRNCGRKQVLIDATPRTISRGDRGIGWTVIDYPFSQYSEGIRSIKLAIDMENKSKSSRVIGLTSAMPGEGKSTVALSIAQFIASNGVSVILVDCDIRNPSLTRSLAPDARAGLSKSRLGRRRSRTSSGRIRRRRWRSCRPSRTPGPPDPPSVLLSAELRRLFDELRSRYQFVVVDLSPFAPVIDVCATTEFIDSMFSLSSGAERLSTLSSVASRRPVCFRSQ